MKKPEKLNCRKDSDSNYKRKRFIILIYKEHVQINKEEISGYGDKKKKKKEASDPKKKYTCPTNIAFLSDYLSRKKGQI